jgi:hypothetical protein
MKLNKVAAAYNYAKYFRQRTEVMQWWADCLDAQKSIGAHARSESVRFLPVGWWARGCNDAEIIDGINKH